MPPITAHLSISLDGFVAGPDQSQDNPLGVGGIEVHRWRIGELANDADRRMNDRLMAPRGAYVMGRNMFGPVRGEWDDSDWRGWWGDEPPYHAPVFVLTHYPHAPIEMKGGTTFYFVGDFDEAIKQAVTAAGNDTVTIAGGSSAVRQGLQRGIVDEIMLSTAPVLLGSGERLFDGITDLKAEPIDVAASPLATHVVYRIDRSV
ncbi:dihydrofolate reductase family protein [Kineosporia mesophila]|uniref:Dihydrofolate reductase family protein n=1 Tax=Kineosporia mesophila TaxID=566012 RepID=A0ABP6Z4P5_9ACTN|nr:dihydrofolate reductase family protein [Kineosporia mesophila]MCD5355008.1 dihydrofolate reductase family protein [Kineosporia mesophila]